MTNDRKWIESAPLGWELVRFSKVFSFSRGLDIKKQDLSDYGLPVISYGQIHAKENPGVRVLKTHIRHIPEQFVKKSQLERACLNAGDIVFADTSEDVEGAGNMVRTTGSESLFAGYHTLIARPSESFRHMYMAYQMISSSWRHQLQRAVQGVKVFSITQSMFGEVTLLKPPLKQQKRIVEYLDHKTTEIDHLLYKLRRQVELLERYRRELIAHTVTHGLDPDVPMRDSGIDWVGEIPLAWKCARAKALFFQRKEKSRQTDVHLTPSQKYGVLPQEEYIRVSGTKPVLNLSAPDNMKHVDIGDFIIHLRSFQGGLELSSYVGKVSNAYTVISGRKDVNNQYFRWLLKSPLFISRLSTLTDQLRDGQSISFGIFSKMFFPLPPLEEQEQIAIFLETKTTEIDSTISNINKQIELLGKYRKQVINDAVTGKVRVEGTE
ncbi:restriction endonuclease subunit S [uncultured Varibaculum sp.]|uniref:restriction endonuclease subunit S n=1 Tax=uncultured Varibaculum sp. TaxID=413896 RepID=UPI002804E80D|nr:restriction endonuclease subunit S [uncultured Varibaculum sp.]